METDQSSLCDEASIKIPEVQGSESFRVAEHMEVLGGWHMERAWKLRTLSPSIWMVVSIHHILS